MDSQRSETWSTGRERETRRCLRKPAIQASLYKDHHSPLALLGFPLTQNCSHPPEILSNLPSKALHLETLALPRSGSPTPPLAIPKTCATGGCPSSPATN